MGGSPSDMTINQWSENHIKDFENIQKKRDVILNSGNLRELDKLQRETENLYSAASFDAYKRLTGEAQARATQDRLHMDLQQRSDSYPLAGDKLSDIPVNKLITRYGSDKAMSVNKIKPKDKRK
jgi:hypothetical protein